VGRVAGEELLKPGGDGAGVPQRRRCGEEGFRVLRRDHGCGGLEAGGLREGAARRAVEYLKGCETTHHPTVGSCSLLSG